MSIINISDFQILHLIAKGQNPVYRVKSKKTSEDFALKKIRRNEFQHHLIDLQEVLYLIQCDHPYITKVLGFCMSINKTQMETEYNLCVLMQLMNNTLSDDIKLRESKEVPYTKSEIIKILVQIASALVYLQKNAKLAHRDIKPDNILIDSNGNCYLSDFGECFWPSRFKPKATTLVGSPYYLAPELKEVYIMDGLVTKEYDPWKSDLWSFGLTLIDLCTTSYASKQGLSGKYKKIEGLYGDLIVKFLMKLLKEDEKNRMDFIEMEMCKELKELLKENSIEKLIGVENFEKKEEEIETKNDFNEEIDSVSQGVFELFRKIEKKGELTQELERELDEKITQVMEIEKINRDIKDTEESQI